jgi:hypothetical protein
MKEEEDEEEDEDDKHDACSHLTLKILRQGLACERLTNTVWTVHKGDAPFTLTLTIFSVTLPVHCTPLA